MVDLVWLTMVLSVLPAAFGSPMEASILFGLPRVADGVSSAELKQYTIPMDTPVAFIESQSAFDNLTSQEKLYLHHFSRASWLGGVIDFYQTSVESPFIFLLLQQLIRSEGVEERAKTTCGFTNDGWDAFKRYATAFYSNLGNYHSYGMKKFIPSVDSSRVECLIESLANSTDHGTPSLSLLWELAGDLMYNLSSRHREQSLKPTGVTTYFSSNCDAEDAQRVQEYMVSKHVEGWNTRLLKTVVSGSNLYEIRYASSKTSNGTVDGIRLGVVEEFRNSSFWFSRGDFSEILNRVNEELLLAKKYASKQIEKDSIDAFVESFQTGSLAAHKKASKLWVQNKGPVLETYIGFIETYQDPSGQRASFEGFISVVDKAKSARLGNLVANAESFLPLLPWPKEYEKDVFLKPDFTDLSVVSFANGGVPAGINIPNYNEIRQVDGFKNVNLGNVIAATYSAKKVQFLKPEDEAALHEHMVLVFDITVGLHELLGHGSGKLFLEFPNGTRNFDAATVPSVEPYGSVKSWYKPGETYESVFGKLASTMEECRAETAATYLTLFPQVLTIWGINETEAERFGYLTWLQEASAGITSLAQYKPDTDSWGEAHAQGHVAILRVMQESGVATIEIITGADGEPDILVTLDRARIPTDGKKAMGTFLLGLEFYRSTGDVKGAFDFYDKYTGMKGENSSILSQWQKIALDRQKPRSLVVQPNTVINQTFGGQDATVLLRNYNGSADGMIQSFRDRFSDLQFEEEIFSLAMRDRLHFLL